jgi:hypothetical protein
MVIEQYGMRHVGTCRQNYAKGRCSHLRRLLYPYNRQPLKLPFGARDKRSWARQWRAHMIGQLQRGKTTRKS